MCAFLGLDGVLLLLQLVIAMLPVVMRLFHGTVRKAFRGPMCGRVWCGRMYLGRNIIRLPLGFQFPISINGKNQSCLHQGQTEGPCPEFLFPMKA